MAFYHHINRVTNITDLSYHGGLSWALPPSVLSKAAEAGTIAWLHFSYLSRSSLTEMVELAAIDLVLKHPSSFFLPTPGHPVPPASSAGEPRKATRKTRTLILHRGGLLSLSTWRGVTKEQPESWPQRGTHRPTDLLWRDAQSQGQWKGSGTRSPCRRLRAVALDPVLMTSVSGGQDNPAFKPTLWAPCSAHLLWPGPL